MVENKEPPKPPDDQRTEQQFTPFVSHRLRAKMEDRDDDESEKSGPAAAIAVIGLLAVILVCGGLFLLGQKNTKKTPAAQNANASQSAGAATDSAAAADSIARLAAADSMSRAQSQPLAGNKPQPVKPKPVASKSAVAAKTAAPAAGAAGNGPATDVAPAPVATKFGIAVGSFLFDDKAASEKDRLAGATSLEATVIPKSEGGTTTYQVVLGSFDSRAAAQAKGNELLTAGTVKESQVVKLKK